MTSHMNFDQRQARLKMITAQYEVARTKRALAKLGGKVALTSQMNFALKSSFCSSHVDNASFTT